MNAVARGKVGQLILRSIGEVTIDSKGVASGSAQYYIHPYTAAQGAAPRVGIATHPWWPQLGCSETKVTRDNAGGAHIRCQFKGPGWEAQYDAVSVTVSATTYEASITTHPSFNDWAGTGPKDLPQNNPYGACWALDEVDDGQGGTTEIPEFLGFWIKTAANVRDGLYQVDSWEVATVEATVTTTRGLAINKIRTLAKIGDVLKDAPYIPRAPGKRDWKVQGVSLDRQGNSTVETMTYRMSGPRGWSKAIYGKTKA